MTVESSPPLLFCVDAPSGTTVRGHNGRVVLFRGWVASTRGRSAFARYRLGRGPWQEIPTRYERADVIENMRADQGVTDARIGFEFYVRLPRRLRRGATIELELSDGEVSSPPTEYRVVAPDGDWLETYDGESPAKRDLATRYLEGNGIEFGALHQPLAVDPARARVRYADRHTREQALEVFPELREHHGARIVNPDFIVDLDLGDLTSLAGADVDFFVANDVIEHLANPVQFLAAVHAVMRPGAVLFLTAPDRDFTWDVARKPTPNRHLWREYEAHVREVDDAHILEFVKTSTDEPVPSDPAARAALIRSHRERSVHVHVWDQPAFDRFLEFACARVPLRFRLVDRARSCDARGGMIYVLERLGDDEPVRPLGL